MFGYAAAATSSAETSSCCCRRRPRAAAGVADDLHAAGDGPLARPPARADGPARRRHRVPGRADRRAHAAREPRRCHGVHPRHHRAARARGAAAPVAEARGDRPARRRRRARLQQHPHEHHGLRRSAADADRRATTRRASEAAEIKQSVERGAGLTRQLLAFSRRQATQPAALRRSSDVVAGMDTMLRRLIGPEIEFEIVRPERADDGDGRLRPDRAGGHEPGRQRARRDAAKAAADDRASTTSSSTSDAASRSPKGAPGATRG